jgi:hypothetical protein
MYESVGADRERGKKGVHERRQIINVREEPPIKQLSSLVDLVTLAYYQTPDHNNHKSTIPDLRTTRYARRISTEEY